MLQTKKRGVSRGLGSGAWRVPRESLAWLRFAQGADPWWLFVVITLMALVALREVSVFGRPSFSVWSLQGVTPVKEQLGVFSTARRPPRQVVESYKVGSNGAGGYFLSPFLVKWLRVSKEASVWWVQTDESSLLRVWESCWTPHHRRL